VKGLDVVPVAAVATGVADASNPNVVVLPSPNAVVVDALVVLPEPNVNGFAEAVAVGAVVLKPPPNANAELHLSLLDLLMIQSKTFF
jgi:hypothetical protein